MDGRPVASTGEDGWVASTSTSRAGRWTGWNLLFGACGMEHARVAEDTAQRSESARAEAVQATAQGTWATARDAPRPCTRTLRGQRDVVNR